MNLLVWSHSERWRTGWKSVMALVLAAVAPAGMLEGASGESNTPAAASSGQIQPQPAVPAGGSEWGESVEGISARLATEKRVWDES